MSIDGIPESTNSVYNTPISDVSSGGTVLVGNDSLDAWEALLKSMPTSLMGLLDMDNPLDLEAKNNVIGHIAQFVHAQYVSGTLSGDREAAFNLMVDELAQINTLLSREEVIRLIAAANFIITTTEDYGFSPAVDVNIDVLYAAYLAKVTGS